MCPWNVNQEHGLEVGWGGRQAGREGGREGACMNMFIQCLGHTICVRRKGKENQVVAWHEYVYPMLHLRRKRREISGDAVAIVYIVP